jgi:hypothetical protein
MSLRSPIAKGSVIKIGLEYYQIETEEVLNYKYTPASTVAAGGSSSARMSELLPTKQYIYWVQSIGVDGGLSFQVQFPISIFRNTPPQANTIQKFNRMNAHYLNGGADVSFFITHVLEPILNWYNELTVTIGSDFYFTGMMYKVKLLDPSRDMIPKDVIEVSDLAMSIR